MDNVFSGKNYKLIFGIVQLTIIPLVLIIATVICLALYTDVIGYYGDRIDALFGIGIIIFCATTIPQFIFCRNPSESKKKYGLFANSLLLGPISLLLACILYAVGENKVTEDEKISF